MKSNVNKGAQPENRRNVMIHTRQKGICAGYFNEYCRGSGSPSATVCCSRSLFPAVFAVIARCYSLLFGQRVSKEARNSAVFPAGPLFFWKNSENSGGSRL